MRAVSAPGPHKAVGKDAAFEILGKRLAHIGLGGAVVALTVELACTGKVEPSLVVLGYRLVQQRALGMARVVELRVVDLGLRCGRHNTAYINSIMKYPN